MFSGMCELPPLPSWTAHNLANFLRMRVPQAGQGMCIACLGLKTFVRNKVKLVPLAFKDGIWLHYYKQIMSKEQP